MVKELTTMNEVIRALGLEVLNYNKQHGYAILSNGRDMVCIEKNLKVRMKEPGYYMNDEEYRFNKEVYEFLRLNKLAHLQA